MIVGVPFLMCQTWISQVWSLSAWGWWPKLAQSFLTASCSSLVRLRLGKAVPL